LVIEIKPTQDESEDLQLGKVEEKAIISLAFDQPDIFSTILPYLQSEFFKNREARVIFDILRFYYQKHDIIINREMCSELLMRELTADDSHKEILDLVNRQLDPREAPVIIDHLTDWARKRALGKLFTEETQRAFDRGDFDSIDRIIEDAHKISNVDTRYHFFFDEYTKLYARENERHFTTGFARLDAVINTGGPISSDVFCWMGPTGGGKSIALINSGAMNVRRGCNVLHVTLEMTWKSVALRYMSYFSKMDVMMKRFDPIAQGKITAALDNVKSSSPKGTMIIVEYPPDEVSCDTILNNIDILRRLHGISIDVVIIDYLELLLSRIPDYNRDDYIRQKRVSTEISRLAKKANVVVFTGTQTNRSAIEIQGKKEALIGINKVAESYGKAMPISYLVTINSDKHEYEEGRVDKDGKVTSDESIPITQAVARLHVVKNRNGPNFITINLRVNYSTMRMEEEIFTTIQAGSDDITSLEETT
jgi:replicative DNA helicase